MIKQGHSRNPLIQLLIAAVISIITAITSVLYMVMQDYMGFTTPHLVVSCSSYLSVKFSSSNVFIVSFLANCLSVIPNLVLFGVVLFTFLKYDTLELLPHRPNRYMSINKFIGLYFVCSISLLMSVCIIGYYASLILQVAPCVGYLSIHWIAIGGIALIQLVSISLSWIRIILLIRECRQKDDPQEIEEGNQEKLLNQQDTRIIGYGNRFNSTEGNEQLLQYANGSLREQHRGRVQQHRKGYGGQQGQSREADDFRWQHEQLNEDKLRQENRFPRNQLDAIHQNKSSLHSPIVKSTSQERLSKERKEAAIMKELGLEPIGIPIEIPIKKQENIRLSPPKIPADSPKANKYLKNRCIMVENDIKEVTLGNSDTKKRKKKKMSDLSSKRKGTMEVQVAEMQIKEPDMEKYRRPVRMPVADKVDPLTEFAVQNKIVEEEAQIVFHKKPDIRFDPSRMRKKLFDNEDIRISQQYDSVLSGFGGEVVEVDAKTKELLKELKDSKKTKKNDSIMIQFIRSKYVEEESNSE